MNKLIGLLLALGINVAFGYTSAAAADIIFGEKEEKEDKEQRA